MAEGSRGGSWGIALAATALAGVAANGAATQVIAALLAYDPALGPHWRGLYPPWMWARWWDAYGAVRPDVIQPVVVALSAAVTGWAIIGWAAAAGRKEQLVAAGQDHGTAKWAEAEDIEAARLFAEGGVHLGAWTNPASRPKDGGARRMLRHDGDEHVAVIAPTRSGKGVGIIVPTLLTWRGAAVVYDQKGELWDLTSGWRAANVGPVYRFEPADRDNCCRFNPLYSIRIRTSHEVGDAQNLARIIIDPDGNGSGTGDHWTKSAEALLVGMILFVLYEAAGAGRTANMGDLIHVLTDPERPQKVLFLAMATNTFGPDGARHPLIAGVGADSSRKPDKEMASIWSTAVACLAIYRDPILIDSLRGNTITYEDIVDSDRPATVYLVTGETDKDRLRPFVRLFVSQLLRVLLRADMDPRDRSGSAYRHRLLFLLDEFISLGKIDYIQEALSFVAGYGIRAMLVIQDISQLQAVYGRDETILANTHVRAIYAPNRVETAEWISRSLGAATETTTSLSKGGKDAKLSKKFDERRRELMTPDEVMRIKKMEADGDRVYPGKVLLMVAGQRPVLGEQTPYFLDAAMAERAAMEPVDCAWEFVHNRELGLPAAATGG